ncbi:MAG: hypothetical protein LAO06_12085 [Acidobacteriia bacterium]|nr:hypothetical protein [Terriglobia bacterium]
MNFLFAILVVAVVGYAVASTARIPDAHPRDVLLLRLGLAPGMGFGLVSIWYLVALAAGVPRWAEIGVEILAGGGAAGWLYWKHQLPSRSSQPRARTGFVVAGVISVTGLFASFWIRYAIEPLGFWDAWALWNAHARILDLAGHNWREVIRASVHPDYPALLSVTVARMWHSVGGEPTWIPALIGFLFLVGTTAILYGTLGVMGQRDASCVALVLLGLNFGVPAVASSQCADWPLAYFFTGCLALILLGRQTTLLGGLMAGLAAWTKNEGLLFALVLGLTFAVLDRRVLRALVPPLALMAAVVLWYKWAIHVPNDLFQPSGQSLLPGYSDPRSLLVRVTDYHRLRTIASRFSDQLAAFGILLSPALIVSLQPSRRKEWLDFRLQLRLLRAPLACVVTLVLMIAGYAAVYVITPMNVEIHLTTSIDRLFVQLWPGTLLCALAVIMFSPSTRPETGDVNIQRPLHSSYGED